MMWTSSNHHSFCVRAWKFALMLSLGAFVEKIHAKDFFLTIGGGPEAPQNQVALEKNVHFYDSLLKKYYAEGSYEHKILFADGMNQKPDLVFENKSISTSEVHSLLSEILMPSTSVHLSYRSSGMPRFTQSSSVSNLSKIFSAYAQSLTMNDRFLYMTGHGGKGRRSSPHNTRLFLWRESQDLTVRGLVKFLERIPKSIPIFIFGTQCYSGGFGRYIFRKARESQGMSQSRRAGFFSTRYDRLAAGCSADTDESTYQDYATHFFSALAGHTRTFDRIHQVDFNEDGRVDFLEAHAYAQMQSLSIDIGVLTSDILLRQIWSTEMKKSEKNLTLKVKGSSIQKLLTAARLDQKAVLLHTIGKYDIPVQKSLKILSEKRSSISQETNTLKRQVSEIQSKRLERRLDIGENLLEYWPFLAHPWHPETIKLISLHGDHVREIVELSPTLRISRVFQSNQGNSRQNPRKRNQVCSVGALFPHRRVDIHIDRDQKSQL